MRILFIVPYVPNLVRVRPYQLIRHLAARGHEITLLAISTNEQEKGELQALRSVCAEVRSVHIPAWWSVGRCALALPTRRPLQASYSWSTVLRDEALKLSSSVDVIHVEHLRGARYARALAVSAHARVPVVWDSVDCISDLFSQAVKARRGLLGRAITRIESRRTRRFEASLMSVLERVLVSSDRDRRSLLALAPGHRGQVTVLTNGVDLDYFRPGGLRDPETLVFSGKMSYHANEAAAAYLLQDIMPRVWNRRPRVRVVLAGKDPSRRLRALVERHEGVVVLTGTVPDIRPYLQRASIAVVPLVYGAGCQNKVLEAMATATPVVATSRAVSALTARNGRDVMVADDPEMFAQSVIDLLDCDARQRALGTAGRRYVEEHHRWGTIAGRLEAVYAEALDRPDAAGPLAQAVG